MPPLLPRPPCIRRSRPWLRWRRGGRRAGLHLRWPHPRRGRLPRREFAGREGTGRGGAKNKSGRVERTRSGEGRRLRCAAGGAAAVGDGTGRSPGWAGANPGNGSGSCREWSWSCGQVLRVGSEESR